MDILITPSALSGSIPSIASKSDAHRILICAALSDYSTIISNISDISADIKATISCINSLGGKTEIIDDQNIKVSPINFNNMPDDITLDCSESGSTLRFLLPIAAALNKTTIIRGHGRLPNRPLSPLKEELILHGIDFEGSTLPLKISGSLESGDYYLPGDVSSQYISGLLFALPLLNGDSTIHITSPLQSSGYVDMTISTLSIFGISVIQENDMFFIEGSQTYRSPLSVTVEGDWSNAAFWFAASYLKSPIVCTGLSENSLQQDKRITELLSQLGENSKLEIDASNIPDLVPILSVVASLTQSETYITNAARLKIKESDRLFTVCDFLTRLGADIKETEDGLRIKGKNFLNGGEIDSHNDHRIVMAAAIAAIKCNKPVIIRNADAVNKSYPRFFEDYKKLGGKIHVI